MIRLLLPILLVGCHCHHAAAEPGDAYKDSRDAAKQRQTIYRSRKLESDQKKVLPESYVASCVVRKKSYRDDGRRWEDDTDRTWGGDRDRYAENERERRQEDRDMGSPSNH